MSWSSSITSVFFSAGNVQQWLLLCSTFKLNVFNHDECGISDISPSLLFIFPFWLLLNMTPYLAANLSTITINPRKLFDVGIQKNSQSRRCLCLRIFKVHFCYLYFKHMTCPRGFISSSISRVVSIKKKTFFCIPLGTRLKRIKMADNPRIFRCTFRFPAV